MTGKGHRYTGIGTALIAAATARLADLPELPAAVVAAVSTTVPDWAEIPFYRNGQRVGSLITHRTLTHWPPLWLGVLGWALIQGGLPGALGLGVALGALAHILGDAPNPMGIPWLLPHQRLRIGKKGLWRSGQWERTIILGFAVVGYAFWRVVGGEVPWD